MKNLHKYIEMDMIIKTSSVCFICNAKVQRDKIYCVVNMSDNTIREIKNKKPIVCGKCLNKHSLR